MKKALREMLSQSHWRGGIQCQTCSHKKARLINRDITDFCRAKRAGNPMPWSVFREYLHSEYKFPLKAGAVIIHARRCLKLEI